MRKMDEQTLIHINGDMRWVVGSDEPLLNLSSSLVQGYNGGSLDFMWRNHLHSLGGYGLWRRHFDLIRFHGGGQGWQKVATEGQKPEDRSIQIGRCRFTSPMAKHTCS